MKKYEVLTDESIFEIKRAINFLETINDLLAPNNSVVLIADNVSKLKAIIKNVQDE